MIDKKFNIFECKANDAGKRIDKIVKKVLPAHSLGGIYSAFRKKDIRLNGKKTDPSYKVKEDDQIWVHKSLIDSNPPGEEKKISSQPSRAGKWVLFEDDHILAINKPKGIIVHGPNSLELEVVRYLENRITDSLSFRPGPLHRLDRNTTGLIFFSKSINGAREFSEKLQQGLIKKYYLALLSGTLRSEMVWMDHLERDKDSRKTFTSQEGKLALTEAVPLCSKNNTTLVLCKIHTGRTHQIRAQAGEAGFPLLGDKKYGGLHAQGGYFLHAYSLMFAAKSDFLPKTPLFAPVDEKQIQMLELLFGKKILKDSFKTVRRIITGG